MIAAEERELESRFGQAYRDDKRRVPGDHAAFLTAAFLAETET
ncbi:MAG TPA: hypothetical protein VF840_00130 [Terriglobales bacterium]